MIKLQRMLENKLRMLMTHFSEERMNNIYSQGGGDYCLREIVLIEFL